MSVRLTDEIGQLDFSGSAATSKLELSFRCKGLCNLASYSLTATRSASTVCVLYVRDANSSSPNVNWNDPSWRRVGCTEVQSNTLDPVFVEKQTLNYYFEQAQPCLVRVYDLRSGDDDVLQPSDKSLIGYAAFTLAELVSAPAKRLAKRLENALKPARLNGLVLVHGEEPVNVGCRVAFQIRASALETSGSLLGSAKPDPYCVVSKAATVDSAAAPARSSLAVPGGAAGGEPKRRSRSPLGTLSKAFQARRERRTRGTLAGATSRPYAINRDDWTPVLCTEVAKKARDVDFARVSISLQELCNADDDRPLLFEVYDHHANSKPDLIGACRTTFASIRRGERLFQLVNDAAMVKAQAKKKTYANSGMLELLGYELTREPSFMEYIVGGCELALVVGIDFTASNGPPSHPQSLHRLAGRAHNEYEQAIAAVGDVLAPYDTDALVPAFGFGAELDGELSHCFPLRADHNACHGVAGVLEAYRDALERATLSGPTVFSEIIRAATAAANAEVAAKKQSYTVLLLLTDGVLEDDLEPTLEAIVQASAAPLSIIIVGVGRADFGDMDRLDSDDQLLVGPRSGRKAVRDAVQFVPFRQFKDDPPLLAREVLYELPRQFIEYSRLAKWHPQPPPSIDIDLFAQFQSAPAPAPAPQRSHIPVMTVAHPVVVADDDDDDAEALLAMFAKPPVDVPATIDVPDLPDFSDDDDNDN